MLGCVVVCYLEGFSSDWAVVCQRGLRQTPNALMGLRVVFRGLPQKLVAGCSSCTETR